MLKKILILFFTITASVAYSQSDLVNLLNDYNALKQSNEKKILIDSIKNVFSTNTYKRITKKQENEVFHLLFNFYKNDTKNFLETKLLFADKNLEENRSLSIKLLDSVLSVSKNKSYHQIQTKAYSILGFANNFEPKKSNDYYFKALKLITQHKLETNFKCELLLQIGDNFNRLDDSGKAIDYYIKVKECEDKQTYSKTYLKSCIGLGKMYNSIFDRLDAVSNFQEGLQHIIKFKKNEPLMQMRFREGLAVALTNHPLEGSEKMALDLANLAYLTSKTDYDDNFKIESLRQILYLNAFFKNNEKTKKAYEDLKNIISNEKYGTSYNNYLKFGELAISISQRNRQKTEKLIKEFKTEFYKDSPNLLKEQFLHLIYINDKNNSNKGFNSYKKWNKFRDSTRLDFYKNYKDSLQVRYQKASTDKEITRLSNLNELDKVELNYKNKNLYLLLSILTLLIILLLIIFYFNKKLRKQKNLVESLQKELHHRVKNNLSIIDTFIEVTKEEFEDEKFTHKLTELQNRIDSINEVHQQLYKNKDITNLNLKNYIDTLSSNVSNSFSNTKVIIEKEVEDNLNLNADKSFPVGLIINEFLTNSYKYAFGDDGGKVKIKIKKTDSKYNLTLSDNGKGLPKDFNIKTSESFGLRIIKLLAEQLNGSFELNNTNGVELNISFPK